MSNSNPKKIKKEQEVKKNEKSFAEDLYSCLGNSGSRQSNEYTSATTHENQFPKKKKRFQNAHLPEQTATATCADDLYRHLPVAHTGNENKRERGQSSLDRNNMKYKENVGNATTSLNQFGSETGAVPKLHRSNAFPAFNHGQTKHKNVRFDLQQSPDEGWQRVKNHNKRKTDSKQKKGHHGGDMQNYHHNETVYENPRVHKTQMQEKKSFTENFGQASAANNSNQIPQAQSDQVTGEFRTRQHVLGFKELEALTGMQDPYDVLKGLGDKVNGFERTLKQPLRPDLLILVVKLLSKLCKLDFDDLKIQLLSCACEPNFLDQLSKHIAVIPLERNIKRKAQTENLLEDILAFLEAVLNLCPTKAADNFGDIFMITDTMLKINAIQKSITISEALMKKFEQLKTQFETCVEEQEKKKKIGNAEVLQTYELAPNDFRDMSLFPTSEDILSEYSGFLRPNIVDGAYENVDHYLDVQFRLLREDFVAPLREGISQYIMMDDKKNLRKINSVKIYQKVFFLNPKVVKDKVGLIVCFDPDKRLKRVIWEHTKRFMFGSLLVFSKDNFSNVIFGTVMERNIDDLKKGRLLVGLSDASSVTNDLFMNEYVMAESSVYFEPYHHVMKALQGMNELTFPMESYIVHANMSDNPPKYLMRDGGQIFEIDRRAVSVLNDNSWPSAEYLKLDESQYNAFKASLTREFVVVQGPPGTGKTFLGLKVASVLLRNAPVWNASKKPILVVCYTNHALDQFLEGLLPLTQQMVRVGGQSKSEVLQSLNLREKRRENRHVGGIVSLMRECRWRMSGCMSLIKKVEAELDLISSQQGIIALSVLKEVGISDQHLACFEALNERLTERYFSDWLEYGMYEDAPREEIQEDNIQNADPNIENPLENEVDPALLADDMDDIRHQMDDINDLELEIHEVLPRIRFSVSLNQIKDEIDWLEMQLTYLEQQEREDPHLLHRRQENEMIRNDLWLKYNYIKQRLAKEDGINRRTIQNLLQHGNLWELQPEERWNLYRFWVERLRIALLMELQRLNTTLHTETRMYEDAQQIQDLEIMKRSLVVGMTTTGAARLQRLLNALKPKIVIVEEAAEVFESHIVVSLTHHCEHLILIGDHKQLRPSPAVYKLAKDYNFDISLFERMLKNNMHCEVLKVQHRMRPEISELIVPTIYSELLNHNNVFQYEKIRGVLKSLYFITHNHQEEEVDDISSHRNTHEGDFLIELCRYLVLQGYKPSQITILATYSGQMFYLRNVRKQHSLLSEVKITVVDNFQGEENDIILLSLVRSNKAGKIGFLKTENRVCVALSRAKKGLYIIGNMDILSKNSQIWPKIRETLMKQEAISTHLTLRCQIHPSEFTRVCCSSDFNNSPEGGCKQLCGADLPCGHKCKSVCHIRNRDHDNYNCFEQCERIPVKCELQHQCTKRCWQDCGSCLTLVERELPCGHVKQLECGVDPQKYNCRVTVEVQLPDCDHKAKKPCYKDLSTFPCPMPCENRLPCGHICILNCHTHDDPDHLEYKCNKPCARKNAGCKENHLCGKLCHEDCGECSVRVERDLPHCDHKGRMRCSQDPESYMCIKRCQKMLPCGHMCPNICSALCGNCPVKVTKVIPSCGHSIEVRCCENPDPSKCRSPCKKILPCGHPCTTVCSATCTQKCQELVTSRVRPVCGHAVNIPCFMQKENLAADSEKLLAYCQMPCDSLLECEHRCVGTCGECLQGRIHKSCGQKCGKVLICGHSCNVPCAESCPPCTRKCMYRCKHSRCSRLCGQPCIQCKEPCDWSCKHRKCKKFCFELCDREPCTEPCDNLLKCNHPCIGFCGEPCPPLCRICNEDEVTEIFFGSEDEPDARFVLLEDCKHVFESTGLEQWMSQSDEEIILKSCPKCKKEITKTQRYMNIVKKIYKDIWLVKTRVFGEIKAIQASRDELTVQLQGMEAKMIYMTDSKQFAGLHKKLLLGLQPILRQRKNILSSVDVGTLRIQIEIFSELVDYYCQDQEKFDQQSKLEVINYLDILLHILKKQTNKMGKQEVNDFNMEIQRFLRVCQLYKLKSENGYKQYSQVPEVKYSFEYAYKIVKSIEKWGKKQDNAMKDALDKFCKEIKSVVKITDEERKMVVQAMGFRQGHWYKCQNGHVYCIDACGGAMQISKCNECGAPIGGTSHRLLDTNQVASEMDGATRPAWPPTHPVWPPY